MVREGFGISVVVYVVSLKKEIFRDVRFVMVIYELNKMVSFLFWYFIFRGEYMIGGIFFIFFVWDYLVVLVSVWSCVI